MADWAVLGLAGDPVPGDPAEVRAAASRLGGHALTARVNSDRLRAVASDVSGGPLQARGDFAAKYATEIGELPELLGRFGRAYQGCSDALGRFAGPLEDARGRSRAALRRGGDAFDRFTGARRQADALMPPGKVLPWQSGPVGVAGLCVSITVAQADTATTGMDEGARTQVRAAVTRAIVAAADQRTARRLADEAVALRDGAATRCAEEIDGALDGSGIKNKSFWQKAWDTVSAPFRSWDAFVDFCGKVAMVAGVIALFVSGPLGWALMAAALVAGAVILADTLNKYAHGQAGLLDVGLAILGVIPGGRGVLSVTKMARAARGMGPVMMRGGGKVLSRLAGREGDALAGPAVREFDRLFPGVSDVNPNFSGGRWGFQNNCQSCVVATDQTLAGRPAQALERPLGSYHPAFDWPSSVTSTVGTGPLHKVPDYAAIDQEMLAAGDGARGIVHGARTDAAGQYMSGHVFNVVNRDGVIHYVDGQIGDFAVKESFGWMELVRTN